MIRAGICHLQRGQPQAHLCGSVPCMLEDLQGLQQVPHRCADLHPSRRHHRRHARCKCCFPPCRGLPLVCMSCFHIRSLPCTKNCWVCILEGFEMLHARRGLHRGQDWAQVGLRAHRQRHARRCAKHGPASHACTCVHTCCPPVLLCLCLAKRALPMMQNNSRIIAGEFATFNAD